MDEREWTEKSGRACECSVAAGTYTAQNAPARPPSMAAYPARRRRAAQPGLCLMANFRDIGLQPLGDDVVLPGWGPSSGKSPNTIIQCPYEVTARPLTISPFLSQTVIPPDQGKLHYVLFLSYPGLRHMPIARREIYLSEILRGANRGYLWITRRHPRTLRGSGPDAGAEGRGCLRSATRRHFDRNGTKGGLRPWMPSTFSSSMPTSFSVRA